MKRTLSILTVGVLIFASTSCGGGGAKKPEDVAKAFVTAIADEDFETAKKHATEETKKMLGMMESMMSEMGDKAGGGETGEFKEVKEKDIGDKKGTVTYCCDENGEDDEVKLKKVDGEWKVHMDKENPGAGGAGGAGGEGEGLGS